MLRQAVKDRCSRIERQRRAKRYYNKYYNKYYAYNKYIGREGGGGVEVIAIVFRVGTVFAYSPTSRTCNGVRLTALASMFVRAWIVVPSRDSTRCCNPISKTTMVLPAPGNVLY